MSPYKECRKRTYDELCTVLVHIVEDYVSMDKNEIAFIITRTVGGDIPQYWKDALKLLKEIDPVFCLGCGVYHGWDGGVVDCPKEV